MITILHSDEANISRPSPRSFEFKELMQSSEVVIQLDAECSVFCILKHRWLDGFGNTDAIAVKHMWDVAGFGTYEITEENRDRVLAIVREHAPQTADRPLAEGR